MKAPNDFPDVPDQPALLLDFDGTLVELAERPELVRVPLGLVDLLRALIEQMQGAVAIVTGRQLQSVDGLLKPLLLPGAGLHGVELRLDERGVIGSPAKLGDVGEQLRTLFGDQGSVWVEDKGAAVAVHFRKAPERAGEVERVMRAAVRTMDAEVIGGKFIYEARPRGINKGSAVRALMNAAPFKGRTAVYIGDDTTDEDGILAAQALGGMGIKVGEGTTAARFRLADPRAVRSWLENLVDARI